jgi:hypothetical protein
VFFFDTAKPLSFRLHIDKKLTSAQNPFDQYITNGILGSELSLIKQRELYIVSLRPIITYGAEIIRYTQSDLRLLEQFQHRSLCRILNVSNRSSYPAVRALLGIKPITAFIYYLKLSFYCHLMSHRMDYPNISQLIFTVDYYQQTSSTIIQEYTGLLHQYHLTEYLQPDLIPLQPHVWQNRIRHQLDSLFFDDDYRQLQTSAAVALCSYIRMKRIESYYPLYQLISNDLKIYNVSSITLRSTFKLLLGGAELVWKDRTNNLKVSHCILCNKLWSHPLQHLFNDCKQIPKFSIPMDNTQIPILYGASLKIVYLVANIVFKSKTKRSMIEK